MACRPNHIFRDTPDLEWPATRSGVGGLQSPDRAAGLPAICPLTLATHESTRPVAGLPGSPYHPSPSPVLPDPFLRSVTSLRHVPQSCPAAALCRALAPLCRALWPGRPAKLGERGRATRHAGTAPPRRPMEYRNAESLLVSVSFHGPADGAAWSAPANLSTSWSAPANQPTIAVTALPGGRPSMTAWSAPANRAVIAPSAQAADC